jgi:hypothetical protein
VSPSGQRRHEHITAARDRYEHSWAGDISHQLKDLGFVNWMLVLGAVLGAAWQARAKPR